MIKIIVQKNTVDEFPISVNMEGNLYSKNAFIMIHGGGMDHHECGMFIGMKDGMPDKELKSDGKMHTKLYKMPYGNYDRISGELQAKENDLAIIRLDLRNHGESLYSDHSMDTRDTSIERMARDVSCVIDELITMYNYENIHIMGTCIGGLISQCYCAGIGENKDCNMDNRFKVKSLVLDCPLSYTNLYTNNPNDKFNYNKCQRILNEPGYQFNKMKGVYEGINTIKEAIKNGDIAPLVGKMQIPTLYIIGDCDRLVSPENSLKLVKEMQEENNNVTIKIITQKHHGMADHCLYDPQSSDALLSTTIPFIEEQIKLQSNSIKR